jgi:putative flippase GtrA
MKRSDVLKVFIIGVLVGFLVQPILTNVLPAATPMVRLAVLIGFAIFAPLALWIAYAIDKFLKGIYQFAKFAAVGTLNTFVDLGVFNLEALFYGSSAIGTVAFAIFKAVSFMCGTTNSFFWNKYWTFHSTDEARAGQVTAFYAVAIGGLILNTGAGTLINAVQPAGLSDAMLRLWSHLVAPAAGVVASFLWDFLWYKYVVFKKKLIISQV